MWDETEPSPPPVISRGWIVTFSDLIALLLAFFAMLYSLSARDASKVDAAVSSMTEEFARSRVVSDLEVVAARTGILITDEEFLDAVVTNIRGRDNAGQVKQLRSEGGTLLVRLTRDELFLPKTGVLRPEGILLIKDIADAMLRPSAVVGFRSVEVRITRTPEEAAAAVSDKAADVSIPVRQVSSFARALVEADVPAPAISTVILDGKNPNVELAFYTITSADNRLSASSGAPDA